MFRNRVKNNFLGKNVLTKWSKFLFLLLCVEFVLEHLTHQLQLQIKLHLILQLKKNIDLVLLVTIENSYQILKLNIKK